MQRLATSLVYGVLVVGVVCAPMGDVFAQSEPPPPPPPAQEDASDDEPPPPPPVSGASGAAADGEPPVPPPPPSNSTANTGAAAGARAAKDQDGISQVRYLLGGFVGTFYGFGSGHAIVGEYSSTGWMFTISELMAMGVLMIGVLRAIDNPSSFNEAEVAMVSGAIVGLSVLRVWEAIDVWSRPKVAASPSVALTPAVGPDGLGASVLFRF